MITSSLTVSFIFWDNSKPALEIPFFGDSRNPMQEVTSKNDPCNNHDLLPDITILTKTYSKLSLSLPLLGLL